IFRKTSYESASGARSITISAGDCRADSLSVRGVAAGLSSRSPLSFAFDHSSRRYYRFLDEIFATRNDHEPQGGSPFLPGGRRRGADGPSAARLPSTT